MGMFDRVTALKNNVGIEPSGYQTKSLGCTLAVVTIGEDGCLTYTPPEGMNDSGVFADSQNEEVMLIKEGRYSTVGEDPYEDWLNIYHTDPGGVWVEYYIRVEGNKAVKVLKDNEVVFNIYDPA